MVREIHRRRPSRGQLSQVLETGEERVLATGFEGTTAEIERIIGGISYNEMLSSNAVAQKELTKLVDLHRGDRLKIINVFLNLDSFNKATEDLERERKELEGTAQTKGRIQNENEKLELLNRELEEYNKTEKELRDLKAEERNTSETLERARNDYSKKTEIHSILEEYRNVLGKRRVLETEITGKERLLKEKKDLRDRLSTQHRELEDQLKKYAGLDAEVEIVNKLEAGLKELNEIELNLRNEDSRLRQMEGSIQERESKLPAAISSMRQQSLSPPLIGIVIGVILVLIPQLIPLAAVVIFGSLALLIVRLRANTKIQAYIGDLRILEESRRSLDEQKKNIDNLLSLKRTKEQTILAVSQATKRYTRILNFDLPMEQKIKAVIEENSREVQERNRITQSLKVLETQPISTELELRQLEEEKTGLEKELESLKFPPLPEGTQFSEELWQRGGKEKENLGNKVASLQATLENIRKTIEKNKKFLEEHADIRDRVEEQRELIASLEKRLRVVKKAVEGIQQTADALRRGIQPTVARYMQRILPRITGGRYRAVKLDEDYNLEILDPDIMKFRPRDIFSGGADDQFLLAMRLAFALALLPEAKGTRPEFLFLDEPLGSSDEARRTGILDYLTVDLREKFKQIFIISHVGGIEERIPNIIKLEDGRVAAVEALTMTH